jgi:hypothetical protein
MTHFLPEFSQLSGDVSLVCMSRPRAGFWSALVDGFFATKGQILTVIGFLAGVAIKLTKPDATEVIWLVAAAFIILVLVLSLVQALRSALQHLTGFAAWKAVSILKPTPPHTDCKLICVTEATTKPEVGTAVHFVRVHDGIESPIGFGTVRWVQEDEKIQISLDETYDTDDINGFVVELLADKSKAMDQLRLRAGHIPPMSVRKGNAGLGSSASMGEAMPGVAEAASADDEEV